MSLVTLFTDASVCGQTGAAGWAAWAKCAGITMRRGAAFANPIRHTGLAEAQAIANGLHAVAGFYLANVPSHVIVQSDCLEAIRMLGRQPTNPDWRPVYQAVWNLQQRLNLRLTYRHVRGHQGRGDPRSAVNTWVDGEAKRHMRAMRRALQPVNMVEVAQRLQHRSRREGRSIDIEEADRQAELLRLAFGDAWVLPEPEAAPAPAPTPAPRRQPPEPIPGLRLLDI